MRDDYEFYYTQDGSIGLYSNEDSDVYHSKFGALTESWEKFILPSGIKSLLNTKGFINVLDICYGVGYNTKALMSYVINADEPYLKRKNFLQRLKEKENLIYLFKNIFKKKSKKSEKEISEEEFSVDSIDTDNNQTLEEKLLPPIEPIDYSNLSKINIDCLELKEELVKISPFLKTVLTPQEVYVKIIPKIFDCFETYWKLKKFFTKTVSSLTLKNSPHIKEILDLKYSEDYDPVKKDYKIHKYVNYILIDCLVDKYKLEYFTKPLKKKLKNRAYRKYFDKSMIKYANFKQDFRYNFISKLNPLGYLHNIYYEYLSKRYKKMRFNDARKLFNINFMVKDARKSILEINRRYDLIFLDAFTSSKAPELWTSEFIAEIYKHLNPNGVLLTYSTSAIVRNTLLENKFYIGKIVDEKTGKTIGTIASMEKNMIKNPLSSYEMGLCSTKAGIPYHDYGLNSTKEVILKRREADFKASELMSSTKYMNSRLNKNNEDDENDW